MKLNYKLQKLCGTNYSIPSPTNSNTNNNSKQKPNILFLSKRSDYASVKNETTANNNEDIILSPTYNRIQCIKIRDTSIQTMHKIEGRSNIILQSYCYISSHDIELMMIVDEDGYYQVLRYLSHDSSGVILGRGRFKTGGSTVSSIDWYFNENQAELDFEDVDIYIAVCIDRFIEIWQVCPTESDKSVLVLIKQLTGFSNVVTKAKWSKDGQVIIASSLDTTIRVYQVNKNKNQILNGHRASVIDIYMDDNETRKIYSIARDGSVFLWNYTNTKQKYNGLPQKHFLFPSENNATLSSSTLDTKSNLLALGYSNGILSLYELPTFAQIHTLSLSNQSLISSMQFNTTASAIAMGITSTNTTSLCVWEWASETFLIKQTSHAYSMTCFSFSPSSSLIASGGEDGQVKLWKTQSGLNYATMTSKHTAPVSCVAFTANEKVVLSAGLDGVIKAFDLLRYRHFKTYQSKKVQFQSLATNSTSTIVAAGSFSEPFEIYLWNIMTAQLVDVFVGHSAPITSLHFTTNSYLLSTSWDQSIHIWDYTSSKKIETLQMTKDIICSTLSPNQNELAVATLNADITIWDVNDAKILHEIQRGFSDLIYTTSSYNQRTQARDNRNSSLHFTSLSFSADGSCLLACGNSNYVCLYEISQEILLKKFILTHNVSLDGVAKYYTKKQDENKVFFDHDAEHAMKSTLPGAKRLEDGTRTTIQEVFAAQCAFSSTSYEFGIVSTEGLHIYSLFDDFIFDPIVLSTKVTTTAVLEHLVKKEYGIALRYALQLNQYSLLNKVMDAIPFGMIDVIISNKTIIHPKMFNVFLATIATILQNEMNCHVEFYMQFVMSFLLHHGMLIERQKHLYVLNLRKLYKVLNDRFCDYDVVFKKWMENSYLLEFLDDVYSKRKENREFRSRKESELAMVE